MASGGNLDYYIAVSAIYPVIAVALVVESRLSYTSGLENLERRVDDLTPGERRNLLLRIIAVAIGLGMGVLGASAALKALHDGAATSNEFYLADTGLAVQAAALMFLLILRVYAFHPTRRAQLIGGPLFAALGLLLLVGV